MKYLVASLVAAVTFAAVPNLIANTNSSTRLALPTSRQFSNKQQNLIGTVSAIDMAAGKVTVKTDAGGSVTFSTN